MEPQLLEHYRQRLGLKPVQMGAWLKLDATGRPWRVEGVDRGLCSVVAVADDGSEVRRRVRPGGDPVTVGDWVSLRPADDNQTDGEDCEIDAVLERRSLLRRGASDQEGGQQLLAANLDTVFIVAAFASTEKLQRRAIHARRLDRFIAAVVEGGATPVVVLNKVDIAQQSPEALRQFCDDLSRRLAGVHVLCASAQRAEGLAALVAHMPKGDTVAFVGPSGVGKSSLTNALVGAEVQVASDVRGRDAKGRHTTTRGSLITLPSGALIIDTPGVRQFAVITDDGPQGFADIDELAAACRFADCAHGQEPGCAVRAAAGTDPHLAARLDSYLQMQGDAERLRARSEGYARHQQRAADRRFGRVVRAATRHKKSR